MKKLARTGFILGLSILLGLISSCDYTPTETNFKEIAPPNSNIEITVLDTNTVNQLRGRVTIPVQTKLNGHTVKYVLGYIDNQEVSLSMSDPSHIVFNTEYYQDGEYTFTIVLVTSSNSGSLADLIGAEVLYSVVNYRITIFNASVNTPQLEDIKVEDGALKITWEKYDQYCFRNYILTRNGATVATISDVNQTSFIDTTYFCGNALYNLTTRVLNFSTASEVKFFQGIKPVLVSAVKTQDEKMLITWNKYPFKHSFNKYVIKGIEFNAEITSINDTTILDDNPPLGEGGVYSLSVYSKTGEVEEANNSIRGEPIGTHLGSDEPRLLKYIPEKDLLINISYSHETYNYTMSYYDGSSMNLLKSKVMDNDFYESSLGISDNGNYIYYAAGRKVYKLNSSTLLKEDEVDLIDLMPSGSYRYENPIYTIKVNNNNNITALLYDNHSHSMLSFFNMNSKQWLQTFRFNYGIYPPGDLFVSDDQKHIIIYQYIYKYDGINLIQIGSISAFKSVFTKDYASIIATYNDRIQILRSSDMQLLLEIPGIFYGEPCIDSKTGLMGVDGNIYDINSGIKRGSIRVWGNKQFYLNGYYFVNGYYKYIPLNK